MTQETPLPSDRTPAPAPQPRNPVVIVAVGILSVLLWLAVAVQLVIFVPKAERLFDEFKMKVPALTEWVIAYGRWHVPAIACFVLLACIGPGRRSLGAWLFLLLLLPILLNGLVGASIVFPYLELVEGLAGGNKR